MQRLRVRYTKEGRVRFVSARDLTAVWERGLRRADLPIAYSEGFTPHPKVSFPDALPVGFASTGEYAELTFAAPIEPASAMPALSATLPPGMDVLRYQEPADDAPRLARLLPATLWELVWPHPTTPTVAGEQVPADVVVDRLRAAGERLLAAAEAPVARVRRNETKTVDVRPAVVDLHAFVRPDEAGDAIPVLRAVHRNDGPTVRPTDLHSALCACLPDDDRASLPEPRLYRRVAQGEPVEGGLREALSETAELLAPARRAETAVTK